ncbi:MAG TPA: lactate racemase domain-containing protein [Ktedonobacteraceae bacterium]|nr:lactate racemase domain-containing protein [Ktedonobacteraceae bacterium]
MRITFEIPETILHQLLGPVPIPQMARVRNDAPVPAPIKDIHMVIHQQMQQAGTQGMFSAGQRIAIGVGSRGLGRLPEIVAALVSELRALGTDPFIIPTMGSHGGATAEGQRDVLAHLGVTQASVGAPVESQMETVEIGRAADGTPVRLDRLALAADGIVFVARVKPHTAFRGSYESGLAKMIAIGLGKQAGAAACHARGFSEMARMVPALAQVALARAPIRFGLAVLENAHDQPYKLLVVSANSILEREPELLEEAKRAMPQVPFASLDVLVIDEIGKNISGDGADPNITGRYPTPYASGGPEINKQVVLDLSDSSDGNANGIGTADFTTIRLARKMDLGRTYPNALTSTVPGPVALPMVLPSDRLAFAAALLTCNAVGREPLLMRIKNTLRLDEFWVSTGLLEEVAQSPTLRVVEGPGPVEFDQEDNLLDLSFETKGTPVSASGHKDAW